MTIPEGDKVFTGSVPKLYDTYLVPLIFEPYAADVVTRLNRMPLTRVLETACGSGVVTRAMAAGLPPSVQIIATDLNQAMLDYASSAPINRAVEFRRADALDLPFDDGTFDAVVCQFGAMFFPDKSKAFYEARRVLKPGGAFVFNVWDKIEENEFANTVTVSLEKIFPDDPPRFLARTPHGYHDTHTIRRDLEQSGFDKQTEIETVTSCSRAESPRIPAIAYCQGTPLRNEIEARDPSRVAEATEIAAEAVASDYGRGGVEGKIQAHVIVAIRD